MNLRPFQRLNYADVPAKPRIPHSYDLAEALDVRVSSRVMGPVRVHVRSIGSGPPLLLVHGLMTSSYSFRYVLDPLAKHFRVIAVDMPGAGRSDKPLSPYFSAHHFGVFLAELQRELGIRGCAVMGNSLGGSCPIPFVFSLPPMGIADRGCVLSNLSSTFSAIYCQISFGETFSSTRPAFIKSAAHSSQN
jgi:hypothetical protein